jgi:hypothetical protein
MMESAKTFMRCQACGFHYRSSGDDLEACPCGAGTMTAITRREYVKHMRTKWTRKNAPATAAATNLKP